MTNQLPYITEKDVASMLGLITNKGNAWRHLRQNAPHIEITKVFGTFAVKRDELEQWIANGRRSVVGLPDRSKELQRQRLAAVARRLQAKGVKK